MSTEPTKIEPTPCACEVGGAKKSRRDFLLIFGLGLNAIAGAMVGIPIIGYLCSALVKKYELKWINLGPISKFPEGTTRLATYRNPYQDQWDGPTADIPCWVRHIKDDKFQIFAINCTHLGCPVRWFEESKLFMCPCHGGAYYEDGGQAAGPPPRGLYEYPFQVVNNELQIKGGIMPTLGNQIA